jgi:hypothetical protein
MKILWQKILVFIHRHIHELSEEYLAKNEIYTNL